jgi:hypothetical protein
MLSETLWGKEPKSIAVQHAQLINAYTFSGMFMAGSDIQFPRNA